MPFIINRIPGKRKPGRKKKRKKAVRMTVFKPETKDVNVEPQGANMEAQAVKRGRPKEHTDEEREHMEYMTKKEMKDFITDKAMVECTALPKIREEYEWFMKNAILQFGKGNKSAAARARKSAKLFMVLLRDFRKESLLRSKSKSSFERLIEKNV